jgi:hypothetical protein
MSESSGDAEGDRGHGEEVMAAIAPQRFVKAARQRWAGGAPPELQLHQHEDLRSGCVETEHEIRREWGPGWVLDTIRRSGYLPPDPP